MEQGHVVKRRRGATHDRTGCLTCRHRHKKCLQNTFPTCGECVRLNLHCVREPPRQLPIQPRGPREMAAFNDHSNLEFNCDIPTPYPLGKEFSAARRYFLKYYIVFLARMLSSSSLHNSFLSEFLPMAMESRALMDAIVALSAGNLARFDQSYRVPALEAHSMALNALASDVSSLSQDIPQHETTLAACLVLLTCGATSGYETGWYEHIIGAKQIILSTRTRGSDGTIIYGTEAFKGKPEGEWLLRNFAYHDILASVTSREKPLIDGHYLNGITDVIDSYVGIALQVLVYISEISSLEATQLSGRAQEREIVLFSDRSMVIEHKLKAWQCAPEVDPVLVAMAYAYRSAALIYLYRRIRDEMPANTYPADDHCPPRDLQAIIRTEVATILRQVDKIPLNDASECALLFPLFMAGGETAHKKDIDSIRSRLKVVGQRRGFQNVKRACEVLEEVWDAKTHSAIYGHNIPTDWLDIVENQGGGLLLC